MEGINGGTTVSSTFEHKTTGARQCDSNLCLFGGVCENAFSQKCKCRAPFIGKLMLSLKQGRQTDSP